jgi:hypothetical protein
MGQFTKVGDPFLALAEECGEVIQVITKKYRFQGDWDEIPEGKQLSRFQELENEVKDMFKQWERICMERRVSEGLSECVKEFSIPLRQEDLLDGDSQKGS